MSFYLVVFWIMFVGVLWVATFFLAINSAVSHCRDGKSRREIFVKPNSWAMRNLYRKNFLKDSRLDYPESENELYENLALAFPRFIFVIIPLVFLSSLQLIVRNGPARFNKESQKIKMTCYAIIMLLVAVTHFVFSDALFSQKDELYNLPGVIGMVTIESLLVFLGIVTISFFIYLSNLRRTLRTRFRGEIKFVY
jgi:hypothetical protein